MLKDKFFAKIWSLIAVLSLLSVQSAVFGQVSEDDCRRAESFLWENIAQKKVYNLWMTSGFAKDSSGLWYLERSPKAKTFEWVDFKTGESKRLFDHDILADKLAEKTGNEVKANKLPFNKVEIISNNEFSFSVKGEKYQYNHITGELIEKSEDSEESSSEGILSPDGKWEAFSKEYNLYIRSVESEEEFQLTFDGKKGYEYATYYGWYDLMKGEGGKRSSRFYVDWSPDSKYLQADLCDMRSARKMYLLDYSQDTLYRPELYSYFRGSPGDTSMVEMTPYFFDVEKRKALPIELEKRTHINNYWIQWLEESNNALVLDRKRGFKSFSYSLIDLSSGIVKELYGEISDTNIPEGMEMIVFEDKNKFVFFSEKSGWQHLYSYDLKSGKIKALTQGDFKVHKVLKADKETGKIFMLASSPEKDANPYHRQLCHVNINGGKIKWLTDYKFNHDVKLSPDNRYFIDALSTVETPTEYVLRDTKSGKKIVDLAVTDISKLEAKGWKAPESFTAVARDGKTTIYGAVWKPSNFDPNKKYPVIDHTYSGPHTQMYPRNFQRAFWGEQALAELGFLVVKIDGMGTNDRSKAFHDVSYLNMGENLLDHKLAIEQLAEKNEWVDVDRVGVYGHSAGGYDATHAMLAYPDFFKAAVSSSADHDFRMEKAWWPEMYMGWPVEDSVYNAISNVTMAENLKGKLMLVHGGMDENVNPSATFKLAEALIRADKDFDLLIMPSQDHSYDDYHSKYFRKRLWAFFVKNLKGEKFPWNYGEKEIAQ
ncbi:S9 family peptidase [Aureibacter tunicatorum]|uniref:Dienelactone hydrolase n=1 Tax=Aureibacter tunicatorum TaxID=866807 RepID=A0AAE3XIY2_9BACT|nr:prolyl oligopeptidase family serine peptidase [Aureibacter tunicatorum]MDR6237247.1 dienelactone hydrolase [Aureibacter tunicatorum]BDD06239.1 dipeptidyl peptidase IV [Aureibacter tunicatorum]